MSTERYHGLMIMRILITTFLPSATYDEITDEVPIQECTNLFTVRMIRIGETDKEIIDLLSSDDSTDESNHAGTRQQSTNVITDEIPQHSC